MVSYVATYIARRVAARTADWILENPARLAVIAVAAFVLPLVLAFGLLMLVFAPVAALGPNVKSGFRSGAPTGAAVADIPAEHLPIFIKAQEKYGVSWAVLAAIAKTESDFGRNMKVSSAGAIGYMQFMPDTWEAYKQDGNGDGRFDPSDPWDAVFSAANMLRANGFDTDPQGAVYAYNHAWWYVRKVFEQAAAYSSTMLPTAKGVWPLPPQYREVTSPFGERINPMTGLLSFHEGADIAAPEGTPVYAVLGGVVTLAGWDDALGYCLVVSSPGGVRVMYGHLSRFTVVVGDQVGAGQTIAYSGNTGWSTGPHLHLQVEVNGRSCDPMEWLGMASGGTDRMVGSDGAANY
ncbi:MAG: peptidoglycan DD-metalloendopeptidase family protein [Moorellaceae bacterium]